MIARAFTGRLTYRPATRGFLIPMRAVVSISPFKGIGCMVLSLFTFTVSDAITKWLTQTYPVGELIFVRSFFIILPVLMVVAYSNDWGSLRTVNPRMQLLRTALVVLATALIVTSLKLLPLASKPSRRQNANTNSPLPDMTVSDRKTL